MYSFNPLASIPVDHTGFWMIAIFCGIILILTLINDLEEFVGCFFFAAILVGVAYGVSYHWTNQEPKTFANEQVTAEFQGYAPEGYREKSGKSYVDRHYVYVVYTVNDNPILLQAEAGREYPKRATLYKN